MTTSRRLSRALQRLWVKNERERWIFGTLGRVNADATVTVAVAERPDFCWVKMDTGTLATARNAGRVPLRAGLPVRMRDEGGVLIIDGYDTALMEDDPHGPPASGVPLHPFTDHTDVPSDYTGAGGYYVRVSGDESAVVFQADDSVREFTGLSDVPETYAGAAGMMVVVNGDEDALVFETAAAGADGYPGGDSVIYTFDNASTADSDPGAGKIRFNHATFASITQVFIDDVDAGAVDQQAWLALLDDSTNTVKGSLKVFAAGDYNIWRTFQITSITEATGYWKLTVTPVASAGVLGAVEVVATFARAGDAGTAANIAAAIGAASTDDSIADADLFGYVTGGTLVKTAWSNIKAVLKTYFDTLYVALTGNQTIAGLKTFSSKVTVTADLGVGTGTNSNITANNDASVLSFLGGSDATKGGYVALGGTAHAAGVVHGRVEIVANTVSGSGGTIALVTYNGVSTWLTHMFMTAAGLFGFGTDAPQAKLHILQATLGSVVQRLQSTATNDDPTEDVVQNRVATTDATVTTLHTFTIPASTTVAIKAVVVARRTGGTAGTAEDGAAYNVEGLFKNVAGVATAIGTPSKPALGESQAAWDITVDVTGATARIRVTGATDNNVVWHMTARVYAVSS